MHSLSVSSQTVRRILNRLRVGGSVQIPTVVEWARSKLLTDRPDCLVAAQRLCGAAVITKLLNFILKPVGLVIINLLWSRLLRGNLN